MAYDAGALIVAAMGAREKAYAPYSGFLVGAALLTDDGKIYTGCNIENAAYSPTNCAERTAFYHAVKEGERCFSAIAITGAMADVDAIPDYVFPCGVCRQVMAEFCGPDFAVISARSPADYKVFTLKELFPEAFGPGNLRQTSL